MIQKKKKKKIKFMSKKLFQVHDSKAFKTLPLLLLLHKTSNVSHTIQPYSINERERKREKIVTLNFPFISIFSRHTQYFTTFEQSQKKIANWR